MKSQALLGLMQSGSSDFIIRNFGIDTIKKSTFGRQIQDLQILLGVDLQCLGKEVGVMTFPLLLITASTVRVAGNLVAIMMVTLLIS